MDKENVQEILMYLNKIKKYLLNGEIIAAAYYLGVVTNDLNTYESLMDIMMTEE